MSSKRDRIGGLTATLAALLSNSTRLKLGYDSGGIWTSSALDFGLPAFYQGPAAP
jgi:hypothetical protein